MKKILLSALFLTAAWSLSAQNHLRLQLAPRLGTAAFQLDAPISAGNYTYTITRLEYYMSGISITHDGGQVTPLSDIHLLVRPVLDSLYDLGAQPGINQVEGITFYIGVDQAYNHLDPSNYPPEHPLAPQDPAMHWGWSAGYRFLAIEGQAGSNLANMYQIHALGDANYKSITLSTQTEATLDGHTIHLIADYAKVLTNIDVSGGLIEHSTSGPVVTLIKNMNLVFSAQTSGTIDPAFKGSLTLSPNPAPAGQTVVTMDLPAGADYRLTVTDLLGRVVQTQQLSAGRQHFAITNDLQTGTYFVQLWQDGRPVCTEKLIVAP